MDAIVAIEKLYGLWFLAIGLSLITAQREWKKLLTFWMKNPEHLKLFAIIMLPLGLITILMHNVWTGLSMVVTLVGWLMSIKFTIVMCFPNVFYKVANQVVHQKKVYLMGGVVYFIIATLILVGAFL